MKFKKLSTVLLCGVMLAGCQRINTDEVMPSYEDEQIAHILEEAEIVEPSHLYGMSNIYEKAISLVFEGISDEETMMRLADKVQEYGIDTVLFIPASKVEQQPDLIKYLIDAGVEIGNYGLTGEEALAENSDTKIARQIYLANEYIKQAINKYPDYFMANRSENSESMLKIVEAAGLDGAVDPSIYLNYKSFTSLDKAVEYTTNNLRGDIVSFKLSGELDSTEVQNWREEDEKPAVDKQPTVQDEELVDEEKEEIQDIVQVVEWFIEGCLENNVDIVSLEALESKAQDALVAKEVSEELKGRLDINLYPNLVTESEFGIQASAKVDDNYFDDAVFVGDSIMQGIEEYVKLQRQTNSEFMGNAQFLTMVGMSARNALWDVSEESRHPVYNGETILIQDAIAQMEDVKKVYILLGTNDILLASPEEHMENYQTLLQLIKQQSPQVEFFIISITPGMDIEKLSPDNTEIFERDMVLIEWCEMYGYNYVDLAYALRNERGALPEEWCIDQDAQGVHLNEEGIEAALEFLYTHTKK